MSDPEIRIGTLIIIAAAGLFVILTKIAKWMFKHR